MAADPEAQRRQASSRALATQLVAGYYLGATSIDGLDPPWWPEDYAKGCRHLDEPQVMFSHLSDPATIRCARCANAFSLAAVEVNPDRCDWCDGIAQGRRFREVVIRYRNVICVGNVCRPCHESEALTKEKPTHALRDR